MMTTFTGNRWLDITKKNDMHFVYAFFFTNSDAVHVKVGESTRPYARLVEIIGGSPFDVAEAVFCHAGSKSIARKFEHELKRSLSDFRTRGEWYVFGNGDGAIFSRAAAAAYRHVTNGRRLQWQRIDLAAFRAERKHRLSERRRKMGDT